MTSDTKLDRPALAAALGCFTTWGLFPLLFQAMGRAGATPFEMVGWRTVAAVPFAALLVVLAGQGRALAGVMRQRRVVGALAISAALLGVNWGVYIWSVENGHTLAASLGYYINPLMNVVAAALIFGERMGPSTRLAVGLATIGVVVQALALGEPPWAALALAATFCGYSIVRKRTPVEAQTGLLVECVLLSLPCLVFLAWITQRGEGVFGETGLVTALLLASGPITAVPLFLFGYAARRLPLTAISFLQFITPTMLFAVGALQGEPLDWLRLVSFVFIWAGVGVFLIGMRRRG